jgi:hypothetical protein
MTAMLKVSVANSIRHDGGESKAGAQQWQVDLHSAQWA